MLKKIFIMTSCTIALALSVTSYADSHKWTINYQVTKDIPSDTYLDADVVCNGNHNHAFQLLTPSVPGVFSVTGDDTCALTIGIRHPYSADKPIICDPYQQASAVSSQYASFDYYAAVDSSNSEGVACRVSNFTTNLHN